ncbi:3568_t:CDS:2 [Funneliformis caledonium]|uniref:3568_t:CDS:1 n=1 Tax=Funneliformis caledonium TaxID=1117310 RepID=A0A9N8VXT0_9GLOM|nr:3568_t:CDS:2 [Funneliformis caledonium]
MTISIDDKEILRKPDGTLKTVYYRNDDPSQKNFDKSNPCDIVVGDDKSTRRDDLSSDFDVWVHVYYAPKECGVFSCHMNIRHMYDCTMRYPVSIADYSY